MTYVRTFVNFTAIASLLFFSLLVLDTGQAQSDPLAATYNRTVQLYKSGKHKEALPHALELQKLARKKLGPDHANYAAVLNLVAAIHEALGQRDKVESLTKEALAIQEKRFGPNHPSVARSLNNLANLYNIQGRYKEAEPLFRRALPILEKSLGATHPNVGTLINNLGALYNAQGKYSKAEPLLKKALAIKEKALGPNHPDVVETLNNLANIYNIREQYRQSESLYLRSLAIQEKRFGQNNPKVARVIGNLASLNRKQGKFADAEKLYKRALKIQEQALGRHHPDIAELLNNLAVLYVALGRQEQAKDIFQRTLEIQEKTLGLQHPNVATSLNNLAGIFRNLGRNDTAERLYKRALAIQEKALGSNHLNVSATLNNLANVYNRQKRYSLAAPLYLRALAIQEKSLGGTHPDVALSLNNLGIVYANQGQPRKAEPLYLRALGIYEKIKGPKHPDVATTLNNMAALYFKDGRGAQSKKLLERALSIEEQSLGPDHPSVAETAYNLAFLHSQEQQWSQALSYYKISTSIFTRRARSDQRAFSDQKKEQGGSDFFTNRFPLHYHVAAAFNAVSEGGGAQLTELRAEAFKVGQLAQTTEAAAALSQMASRFAKGTDALANVVRERQELIAEWDRFDKQLISSFSEIENAVASQKRTTLRQKLKNINAKITEIDQRLQADFPQFADFANPKPLTISDVQGLLKESEALVSYLVGQGNIYVWGITKETWSWNKINLHPRDLERMVAKLRRGLDPTASNKLVESDRGVEIETAQPAGEGLPFDLIAAHKLYNSLFGPIEALVASKKHLILVLSGALTSIPFHVLISEKPKQSWPNYEGYRRAAWLVKRHAMTTLPSVSSLKSLRRISKFKKAPKPFIGFGDPIFKRASKVVAASPGASRNISSYFRGRLANLDELSAGLSPLPDTADELKQIAKILGVPDSEIKLQSQATETRIKSSALDQYRIIHFATHGLVAGDFEGLAEPAIALTLPKTATDKDDGLLTASEVAQLKLNAEWVVLSACNTASGQKLGSEALSGLAKSFFFGGTKALLVSHWPVFSNAAVKLTTGTFKEIKNNPNIGKTEALRRSMVALINDNSAAGNGHPSVWAPFVVVGEGGIN